MGVKASYYSRISNVEVYRRAGHPRQPSHTLHKLQRKMLKQVFEAHHSDPLLHIVFSPGLKDRIQSTGRRRVGKIPYWIETTTQRHFPELWATHLGRRVGIMGPNVIYAEISRSLHRFPSSVAAPMRAG